MPLPADLIISKADGRPMYLQIIEQIKQRVAAGDWARGQEIPSIRQLAVTLCVSVITVKRAYRELEREGVIADRVRPGPKPTGGGGGRRAGVHANAAEVVAEALAEHPPKAWRQRSRAVTPRRLRGRAGFGCGLHQPWQRTPCEPVGVALPSIVGCAHHYLTETMSRYARQIQARQPVRPLYGAA